jgi:hypothetical protein
MIKTFKVCWIEKRTVLLKAKDKWAAASKWASKNYNLKSEVSVGTAQNLKIVEIKE